jgi:hypothetical protein
MMRSEPAHSYVNFLRLADVWTGCIAKFRFSGFRSI